MYPNIAKTRHSTPGVGLISPPPHHDIYSIEDLAQLIHDLKNANSTARIHVKLVSSVGVGTVAAGVSKAHADVVLISGYDGGTGAAPLTSLKHAGAPWEIGLADTQQTLVLNGLRDRITVQCDGGMRTARDVIVAALLGAEEFGFATAPLVVSGCIMMRVCHLDTCPVGRGDAEPGTAASGSTASRSSWRTSSGSSPRTSGSYLAELGFRSIDEAVGHAEMLDTEAGVAHWKSKGLDLTPDLRGADRRARRPADAAPPAPRPGPRTRARARPDAGRSWPRARSRTRIRCGWNCRCATSTAPSAPCWARRSPAATARRVCPTTPSTVKLTGSAGQSLGAFLPPGITIDLVGDANDYVGKGLSGGRVVVRPTRRRAVPAGGQRHRRQHAAVRRHLG